MILREFVKIFFIFLLVVFTIYLVYSKFFKIQSKKEVDTTDEIINYNSNIIKDVEYITKDNDGNEYFIRSKKGEIDFSNTNIIYLTDVYAIIKLDDSDEITIFSDFGKYNSENYDTIFSKNVIIKYFKNKITGEYLDFSLERNSMIMSKNVIYRNPNDTLSADVIKMNIKSKDIKIFMHENNKNVQIKSRY